MTWVDVCWKNFEKWEKVTCLHPDDVEYMKKMTYDVGSSVDQQLTTIGLKILPIIVPMFLDEHSDGSSSTVYANTYKLSPSPVEGNVVPFADHIVGIVRVKNHNTFCPYWLLTPGDCLNERIVRLRMRTRFATLNS
jgi:hypothetical protein